MQTGAWLLPDDRPLSTEVCAFLDDGPPPIYVGFGSMPLHDSADAARDVVQAVRSEGRRVVLLSGWWADLAADDASGSIHAQEDVLVVGEVNHQALFTGVAAVVHHGGAGTTTNAARARVPQVVVRRKPRPALLGPTRRRARHRGGPRRSKSHRGISRGRAQRGVEPLPARPSAPRCGRGPIRTEPTSRPPGCSVSLRPAADRRAESQHADRPEPRPPRSTTMSWSSGTSSKSKAPRALIPADTALRARGANPFSSTVLGVLL